MRVWKNSKFGASERSPQLGMLPNIALNSKLWLILSMVSCTGSIWSMQEEAPL